MDSDCPKRAPASPSTGTRASLCFILPNKQDDVELFQFLAGAQWQPFASYIAGDLAPKTELYFLKHTLQGDPEPDTFPTFRVYSVQKPTRQRVDRRAETVVGVESTRPCDRPKLQSNSSPVRALCHGTCHMGKDVGSPQIPGRG